MGVFLNAAQKSRCVRQVGQLGFSTAVLISTIALVGLSAISSFGGGLRAGIIGHTDAQQTAIAGHQLGAGVGHATRWARAARVASSKTTGLTHSQAAVPSAMGGPRVIAADVHSRLTPTTTRVRPGTTEFSLIPLADTLDEMLLEAPAQSLRAPLAREFGESPAIDSILAMLKDIRVSLGDEMVELARRSMRSDPWRDMRYAVGSKLPTWFTEPANRLTSRVALEAPYVATWGALDDNAMLLAAHVLDPGTFDRLASFADRFVLEGMDAARLTAAAESPFGSFLLGTGIRWPKQSGRPLRVGVVGAPSSGKTTLSHALADDFALLRLEDPAVVGAATGTWHLSAPSLEADINLIRGRILEERNLRQFVVESPASAALTYLDARWEADPATARALIPLRVQARKTQREYDLMFYLPADDLPLVDDGFRHTDLDFRNQIDARMLSDLRASGRPFLELRGDHETRMTQAHAAIESLFARP